MFPTAALVTRSAAAALSPAQAVAAVAQSRLIRPCCSFSSTSTSSLIPTARAFRRQQQKQHPTRYRRHHTMSTSTSSPQLPSDRRPIVIAGPSGVGKGTLYKLLFERHPDVFALSISHTTRSPRPGERDGVDYYYVTKELFKELVADDKFVESAQFGSNFYGTSKATIAEQGARGRVVVLDIEMEGVKQVKRSSIDARYVFIAPPSAEELERRLRGRGTESEESVRLRLARANEELEFGHSGAFDKIIVNDDLAVAIKELEDWVYGTPAASSES
ncbi:hypothetical protein DL764_006462 [Monosporascus ibericus]|uniref:Guanylate kinase n=1 Tax=Monosporascus ibericus TaxID=155417 RepID=A0A4Q4T7S3_9PEZI|nr:hypothetical protein DL764_006462 [Monosporascus ibericus]